MGALLTPKKPPTRGAIEILGETAFAQDNDNNDNGTATNDESHLTDPENVFRPRYGFLNLYSGIFTDLAREGLAAEMLQLPDPDITTAEDRREMRLLAELKAFDADRFLGDLDINDEYVFQIAMNMTPHWQNDVDTITQQLSELATDDDKVTRSYFTPEEMHKLASIPYPLLPDVISPEQEESLLLGLLDILFAYVYDHLLTDGDPTTESSWTICTLSSTLSWLDTFNSLDDVVRHSIRRALIYPYLRNYELALYCWKHVSRIWRNGRRCILRSLLQVHNILDKSECHYLGNRLFVDPYLAWIQRHVTPTQLTILCNRLDKLLQNGEVIQKDALDLNLMELERQLDNSESSDEGSDSDESTDNGACDDDSSSSSSTDAEDSQCISKKKENSTELLDSELGIASARTGNLDETELSKDTRKVLIEEV
jgi:protein SHQ1